MTPQQMATTLLLAGWVFVRDTDRLHEPRCRWHDLAHRDRGVFLCLSLWGTEAYFQRYVLDRHNDPNAEVSWWEVEERSIGMWYRLLVERGEL